MGQDMTGKRWRHEADKCDKAAGVIWRTGTKVCTGRTVCRNAREEGKSYTSAE